MPQQDVSTLVRIGGGEVCTFLAFSILIDL
jgi:hypothetical protein